MKYCAKCGNELVDEAIICTKCGCMVEATRAVPPAAESKLPSLSSNKETNYAWLPFVLGILAIVDSLFMLLSVNLSGFYSYIYYAVYLGTGSLPLLSIITSIKCLKSKNVIFPVLGLIFACVSIFVRFVLLSLGYF